MATIKITLVLVVCHSMCYGIFDHGRAVSAAQKNNWQSAQQLLTKVVSKSPDDAQALYDLGVASYKLQEYEQARHYFNKVIQHTDNKILQEKAFFNEGNAHMFQEHYKDAIEKYEYCLNINPDNKEAQHNLDIARKLLEQQEQQQQNEDQEKQDNENNQDQQNQDQNQQNENPDSQNSENSSENTSDNSDQSANEQQKDQQGQQKPDNTGQDPQKNDKGHQEQPQQKQTESNTERSKPKKEDKEKEHESSQSEKKSESASENTVEPWLAQLLDQQDKHDADMNKQAIKALVAQHTDQTTDMQHGW